MVNLPTAGRRLPRALRRPQGLELRPARAGPLRAGVLHGGQDRLHAAPDCRGASGSGSAAGRSSPGAGRSIPTTCAQQRELEFASRKLTTIEINGTYYGSQKPASFRKWHEETPEDFVFAVKGPRFATNRRVLAEAGESIERFFGSGVMELKDKLGPINWQLMATKKFDPDDFAALPRAAAAGGRRAARSATPSRCGTRASRCPSSWRSPASTVSRSSPPADSKYPAIPDPTAPFVYARIMGTRRGRAARLFRGRARHLGGARASLGRRRDARRASSPSRRRPSRRRATSSST